MPSALTIREQAFKNKLEVVATDARKCCSAVVKMAMTTLNQRVDLVEFREASLSGAFMAFTTLGGQFDTFEEFDFEGRHEDLVGLAATNIAEDFQGRGSTAWDYRARMRSRRLRATLSQYQWSSWANAGGQLNPHVTPNYKPQWKFCLGPVDSSPQERAWGEAAVADDLFSALADILPPQEYHLFVEHYINGRSHRDLALEKEPELRNDPCGLRRAEGRINSSLRRGRVRAMKNLPRKWAALAREVAT